MMRPLPGEHAQCSESQRHEAERAGDFGDRISGGKVDGVDRKIDQPKCLAARHAEGIEI